MRSSALVLALLLPVGAAAQEATDTAALPPVQLVKKSPVAAALLEALTPTAGFRYAGEERAARGPVIVTAVGAGLMIFGLLHGLATLPDTDTAEGGQDGDVTVFRIGQALVGAGRLWGVVGAVAAAGRTNARIDAANRAAAGFDGLEAMVVPRLQLGVTLGLEPRP